MCVIGMSIISDDEKLQSLPQDLFERIRDDILKGNLRSGEKLTEQNVCETYKVSRTPVREAFQKLEYDGLIEIIPNRGAFVSGLTPQEVKDMYVLRELYEGQAARWAAERAGNEGLEELRELFELMEFFTMKGDPARVLAMNTRFHRKIYELSGNRMVGRVLRSYQVYTRDVQYSDGYPREYLEEILEEHRAVFEAIERRDPDAAARAAARHTRQNSKRSKKNHD